MSLLSAYELIKQLKGMMGEIQSGGFQRALGRWFEKRVLKMRESGYYTVGMPLIIRTAAPPNIYKNCWECI